MDKSRSSRRKHVTSNAVCVEENAIRFPTNSQHFRLSESNSKKELTCVSFNFLSTGQEMELSLCLTISSLR
ncbi:hypothetical protein PanWU01x14_040650 [Parasponia andersonii]|uniref:Uncharacterized protein n=1 Tax=Parasponia andersonii TaxID=3476 RepID=A0A2P5DR84_PARAD|nr:hypothetical protein PanWU01x14_040650 [Parasponia andersonii]